MRSYWAVLALMCGANLSIAQAAEPQGEEASTSERRLTAWHAPPDCIPIEELRLQVENQIEGEPSAVRTVSGEMRRGPAEWLVTFTVSDSDVRLGERLLQLSGDECRSHDETLALVVALLLEHGPPPQSDPEPSTSEPKESKAPSRIDSKKEQEPPAIALKQDAPPALRLRGGMGWRVMSGWLPSLGWGPTSFVGIEVIERAAFDLAGDYYLPDASAGFGTATVRTSGGRVHLRGCGLPRWERWGASVCIGFGWMALSGSARGVDEPESVLHGSFETSASGALGFALTPDLRLEAGVELVAPFSRGRFVFESATGEVLVHQTLPVLFSSQVGVVLTL